MDKDVEQAISELRKDIGRLHQRHGEHQEAVSDLAQSASDTPNVLRRLERIEQSLDRLSRQLGITLG